MNDAEDIAQELTEIQRIAIEKIGDAGDAGLCTFGWDVNWFSVHFLNRKHPELFTGVLNDDGSAKGVHGFHYVKLTPLGHEVRKATRQMMKVAAEKRV